MATINASGWRGRAPFNKPTGSLRLSSPLVYGWSRSLSHHMASNAFAFVFSCWCFWLGPRAVFLLCSMKSDDDEDDDPV